MLSVIIPSRSPEYLQDTVNDIFKKAKGEIEIIVVYDGREPDVPLNQDPRLITYKHGTVRESKGMRESINTGVRLSKGDYIMKTDEHCMFDEGFDVKLAADCEDNWVVIPRRYRLDPDRWEWIIDKRCPYIDYMHIDYPYQRPNDQTCGLHGAEWGSRRAKREEFLIDDTPSMQGSCYFMSRKHWDTTIKELETSKYGTFTQEAQEIGMKTWFSGGRVVVNKKTWYAHMHKGNRGKGYGFSNEQYRKHGADMEKGRLYCIDYWMNTKDWKYDWEWFINEKFPDIPGWGKDWKERCEVDKKTAFRGVTTDDL